MTNSADLVQLASSECTLFPKSLVQQDQVNAKCTLSRYMSSRRDVYQFLYARLKNGTYYVAGYGVCPSVNFFVSGYLLLQFTSDQAETWYIVRP